MAGQADEARLLVLAPTGRDAALTCQLLGRAQIACEACDSVGELCRRLEEEGGGGILVAEEALTRDAIALLTAMLARQPAWSDVPVLVFAARRDEVVDTRPLNRLVGELGNVTVLERPVRTIALIAAARAALRARGRQYESRAALDAQERAVTARDQFLAMLGHELRNPLGAITLALEMLDRDGVDLDRYRTILRRQANHLGRLVDDLLDVSRVTSGKIVLRPVSLDLAELVARSIAAQENALRDHHLVADLGPAPLVRADPVRLEQVVTNLLTNAIKYTPPGGHIHVEVGGAGEGVVRVTDDGVGIAAEMLPRVFDLFAQIPGSLDRAQGGLGIGLTLVRSLVELHGGSVEASSPGLGRGSAFVVTLPAADAPPIRRIERRRAQSGVQRSILLVEDNVDTCETMRAYLESLGHRVDTAGDGSLALAQAAALRPEVMIVDIGLPGLDGYEVARRMRAARGGDLYLIAVTGYGQPEDRRLAFEAGFDEHFTKPVDLAAITRLLARPRLAPAPARAVHPADR